MITNVLTAVFSVCIFLVIAHNLVRAEETRAATMDGIGSPSLGKVLRTLGPAI